MSYQQWFGSLLERFLEARYGSLGLALALGIAATTLAWTLFDAAGVQGSLGIVMAVLYIGTVFGFFLYMLLQRRKQEIQLRLARIGSASVGHYERSRTIGVVAPISFWSTEYYIQLIKGIRDAAEKETSHHRRRLVVLDVPHEEFVEVGETLADSIIRNVSGVILLNIRMEKPARRDLLERGIPVVSVNHPEDNPPCVCSVLHDHTAFEKLLEDTILKKQSPAAILVMKGLRNPFKGVNVDLIRDEKREIFRRVASQAGLTVGTPSELASTTPIAMQEGCGYILEVEQYSHDAGQLLFDRLEDPTPLGASLVFLADCAAIGFLVACNNSGRAASERGYRVTGFDNIAASSWFDLSSVDYQLEIVSRVAYERLQAALDYPGQLGNTTEIVQSRCEIRSSSDW